MVMTDPIADMLTRIRNANLVGHEKVEIPGSNIKRSIAEILKREGYIRDAEFIADDKQGVIRVFMKYGKGQERVITGLKRSSKPGLRVYTPHDNIPRVLGGLGTAVLSTSHGIVTDKDARKLNIGGEVLCYIW